MTALGLSILALLALAVAGFAAAGAASLRDFSLSQLQEICKRHNDVPRFSEILRRSEHVALGAESLRVLATATAVVAVAAAVWMAATAGQTSPWVVGSLSAVGGALLLWVVLVWLPAAVSRLWAEPLVYWTWRFWSVVAVVLAPSIYGAQLLHAVMHRVSGRAEAATEEESLEEEILTMVSEGHLEGLLEEEARDIIERVMELDEVDVGDIMTPRTDVASLPLNVDWDEAVRFVIESGHTRIPVYGKSRDDIVGVLHIKDLLAEVAKGSGEARRPLAEVLRPPFFVPETKPVAELLPEFQRSRNHLAIVLDEFGGVAGVVTIEDVLEEIVGEIADEHDEDAAEGIKTLDATRCEALARVRIAELNQRLGLNLPDQEQFDTVGGFVFHELGRIPSVGEELVWNGVRIKVLEATRRRIDRVAIEVVDPSQSPT